MLKRFSRVLEGTVVHFKLMRDSYRFLGGLIAYESNSVIDDFDIDKVDEEMRYRTAMLLAEARYDILANNWREMICPADRMRFLKIEETDEKS